jgi:1,4-dihydroxy-2-naphthoate octaprenyltransferase
MMHFGLGDSFDVYLANMKGDPKTVQLSSNRNITLLFRRQAPNERDYAEVEINGVAETVKDEDERQKAFAIEASKSSIVNGLIQSGNTRLLECIRVRPTQVKFRVFAEIVQGVPPTVIDFPENKKAEPEWRMLIHRAKVWAMEVRAPFLTASIIPIILGAMIAFTMNGLFDPGLFLLAFLGGIFIHMGTNVFNDYFDHRSMNDELNTEYVRPFSGGSRMIQLGLMSPLEVLAEAVVLFTLAAAIGVVLAWLRGWLILVFGIVGLFSGYSYTAPPLNLASRGIGELVVGVNFGVLMTLGSYYVQTMTLNWTALVASIPPALLIAAVLYVNEFPDYRADMAVGKRHLVVRLGREKATWGVPALFVATYATVVVGVLVALLPLYALIALLALPFAVKASVYCLRYHSRPFDMVPANASTIMAHMFTGVLLVMGFGFTRLERVGTGYVALALGVIAAVIAFIYWSNEKKEAAMAAAKNTVA